jgi:hypothetical protein
MDGYDNGINKGRSKEKVINLVAVMDSLKKSVDEAMNILKVPSNEQSYYQKLVEEYLKENKINE